MATVNITIGNQLREDLLVTALEGGSNYWYFIPDSTNRIIDSVPECQDHETAYSVRFWKAIQAGKSLPVNDSENMVHKLGEISLESIAKGEQLMADNHISHFANLLGENWDAETADVWFQLAVMGELVYG
jgi:hypothetical protein